MMTLNTILYSSAFSEQVYFCNQFNFGVSVCLSLLFFILFHRSRVCLSSSPLRALFWVLNFFKQLYLDSSLSLSLFICICILLLLCFHVHSLSISRRRVLYDWETLCGFFIISGFQCLPCCSLQVSPLSLSLCPPKSHCFGFTPYEFYLESAFLSFSFIWFI